MTLLKGGGGGGGEGCFSTLVQDEYPQLGTLQCMSAFYPAHGVPFFPLLISQHWVVLQYLSPNLFKSTFFIV